MACHPARAAASARTAASCWRRSGRSEWRRLMATWAMCASSLAATAGAPSLRSSSRMVFVSSWRIATIAGSMLRALAIWRSSSRCCFLPSRGHRLVARRCGWWLGGDAEEDAAVFGHVQAVGDPGVDGEGLDLLLAADDGADPALGQHGGGGDPDLGDPGLVVQQVNSSPMSLLARAADTSERCQKESGNAMGPNALSRIGSPALSRYAGSSAVAHARLPSVSYHGGNSPWDGLPGCQARSWGAWHDVRMMQTPARDAGDVAGSCGGRAGCWSAAR